MEHLALTPVQECGEGLEGRDAFSREGEVVCRACRWAGWAGLGCEVWCHMVCGGLQGGEGEGEDEGAGGQGEARSNGQSLEYRGFKIIIRS